MFDQLFDRDPSGREWLEYLLRVGSRRGVAVPTDPGELITGHVRWWGANDRRLAPPKALLLWLMQNVTEEQVLAAGDREPVRSQRLALAKGDPAALAEAIAGLESGVWNRKWYSLEGFSAPDVFIETERVILIVEGKRSERHCTTKTKWMTRRSQLIRHMDAALELAGARPVLGLLMVEGEELTPLHPSRYWLGQADGQIEDETLNASLPHRSEEQRQLIADGVLGAATWQRICSDFSFPWPPDAVAV